MLTATVTGNDCHTAGLVSHPDSDAPIALTTDASNLAVGVVVEERVVDVWHFQTQIADYERKQCF